METISMVSKQEIRDLYLLAINFASTLNRGGRFCPGSFHPLLKSPAAMVPPGRYHIPESTFGNIAFFGLKLNCFDWVAEFIGERTQLSAPRFQKSPSSYARQTGLRTEAT